MSVSDIPLRGTYGERIMNKFGLAVYQYPTGRPPSLVIIVTKQWCGRYGVRTRSWARNLFLLKHFSHALRASYSTGNKGSPPPR